MAEDDFVREVVASCKARPLDTVAAATKHDILQVPRTYEHPIAPH